MPRNKNTTHRVRAHIMQMVAEASVPTRVLKAKRRSIDRKIKKIAAKAQSKLTDALVAQPAITIVPGSPTELKQLLEQLYQAGWADGEAGERRLSDCRTGSVACRAIFKRLGLA